MRLQHLRDRQKFCTEIQKQFERRYSHGILVLFLLLSAQFSGRNTFEDQFWGVCLCVLPIDRNENVMYPKTARRTFSFVYAVGVRDV